jgi:hypothetical protein
MGETAIRRDAINLVGRGSRTACALSGGFTGLPPKKGEYTKYRAEPWFTLGHGSARFNGLFTLFGSRRSAPSQSRFGLSGASPYQSSSPRSPFRRYALLPLIRITGFINPVGGIHDIFGRTPQLDESVGQKRFAIDPDTGFIGMKDN